MKGRGGLISIGVFLCTAGGPAPAQSVPPSPPPPGRSSAWGRTAAPNGCTGTADFEFYSLFCSATKTQRCVADSDCPVGEVCPQADVAFLLPPIDLSAHLAIGAASFSGKCSPDCRLPLNMVRFDLACLNPGSSIGLPCTAQTR